MNRTKLLLHSKSLYSCNLILLSSLSFNLQPAQSQSLPQLVSAQQPGTALRFNQPSETPNNDPGNRTGGGSRAPETFCSQPKGNLTALVPGVEQPKSNQSVNVLSLTTTAQPTFWFYSPYQPKGNLSATFELREVVNSKLKRFNRQTVLLPSVPGLLSIPLQNKALEVDKKYQWVFSVQCIPGEPSADDSVSGWVQRVNNPTLQAQLQQLKAPRQKVQAYAQAGLWHETLTTLAGELCVSDRPQAQRWLADLTQSVGLTELASKPSVLQTCLKR